MNKKRTLVIIGAGGHGRVVADCAEQAGDYTDIVFLDDSAAECKHTAHWPIVDTVEHWINYRQEADFIVALGNNTVRANIQQQLQASGVNIATIVHPTAAISKHCHLGKGVVVFANAVVNVNTNIADGCIINTGATVDHDCHIGQYCHLSPGVNIAGGVCVETKSWLGIGSSVIEGITIAENSQMGAGAVVTQNTKSGFLYLGVPAKAVRAL